MQEAKFSRETVRIKVEGDESLSTSPPEAIRGKQGYAILSGFRERTNTYRVEVEGQPHYVDESWLEALG